MFQTSFIVLHQAAGDPEAEQKIRQIMSSVKLKPEMYSLVVLDQDYSKVHNALESQKVTHILIFNPDVEIANNHRLNEPFIEQGTSVFITSRIEDILNEERSGETALRRGLWNGMKKWLKS